MNINWSIRETIILYANSECLFARKKLATAYSSTSANTRILNITTHRLA
jgi:hypothetical protein